MREMLALRQELKKRTRPPAPSSSGLDGLIGELASELLPLITEVRLSDFAGVSAFGLLLFRWPAYRSPAES
jgi:hypothetical protein